MIYAAVVPLTVEELAEPRSEGVVAIGELAAAASFFVLDDHEEPPPPQLFRDLKDAFAFVHETLSWPSARGPGKTVRAKRDRAYDLLAVHGMCRSRPHLQI